MDGPDVTMMFVVHDALRRDLARMHAAAARADDPAARKALRAGWSTFSRYLTVHHTAEDKMLWPPMQARLGDNRLLAEMVDEHSRVDPLVHEIDDSLANKSPSHLVALFGELMAALTKHFEHEEAAALPLVREALTTKEWKAFGNEQRRRIGLTRAGWFFPWLLDDAAPETRDTVLGIVPPPLRLIYRLIWEPWYRRRSPWRPSPLVHR
jgi:DUF438 domain-containing protein